MTYYWRGKKWFLTLHIISVKLKFLNKKPSLLMATLENAFSTWGNSRVQLFLSTCWCISLSLVAFGHSWYGEMHQRVLRKSWTLELPHVEKLHFSCNDKIQWSVNKRWNLKHLPWKIVTHFYTLIVSCSICNISAQNNSQSNFSY